MSVKKEIDDDKLSELGADEVDALFDAAQKKSVKSFGGFVPEKRALPTGVRKLPYGFEARLGWGGKHRRIGVFDTPEQASAAYMSVKKDLDDTDLSELGADEVDALFEAAKVKAAEAVGGAIPRKRRARGDHSQWAKSERGLPTGVYKGWPGRFDCRINWSGKHRHIGTFDTPEQASAAFMSVRRDRARASLSVVGAEEADALLDAAKTKACGLCGFVPKKRGLPRGVRKLPSGNYNAQTKWGGTSVYIGTFDTPEQASAVYLSVRKDLDIANLSAPADQVDDVFEAAKAKALKRAGAPVPKKKSKQVLKMESAAVLSSMTAADTIPTCSSNHSGTSPLGATMRRGGRSRKPSSLSVESMFSAEALSEYDAAIPPTPFSSSSPSSPNPDMAAGSESVGEEGKSGSESVYDDDDEEASDDSDQS